ncbi:MAG: hypothetical protein GY765_11230 [bacterium]|nr:hypothetical protein [bacterium]
MNCPNCKEFAPDNNYRCPKCGRILKVGMTGGGEEKTVLSAKAPNITTIAVLAVIILGVIAVVYFVMQKDTPGSGRRRAAKSGGSKKIHLHTAETSAETDDGTDYDVTGGSLPDDYVPGMELDVADYVQTGEITIFDFYSNYCPPCVKISPLLERLDREGNDITVIKINVNREGVKGIDWRSPVLAQYDIRSLPFFMIFDTDGKLTHDGKKATKEVYRLLGEEGIL